MRLRAAAAPLLMLLVLVAPKVRAQASGSTLLPQWEAHAGVTAATVPAAHAGAGVNVRAGSYVRLGVAALAGAARAGGVTRASQRVDITARFLLDPFAERRTGLYGGAGLTARHDAGGAWKGSLVLLVGIEGATRGRAVPALELGLGGGVRAAVVLRTRRPGRGR
jgi:hypothetical protein